MQTQALQKESLEAEQSKFQVGASTSFFIIQYESFLSQARSTVVVAKGAYLKAQAALERAVSLRPQDPEANYSLAMVYAQTDETDRAYKYLQTALTLRPNYPEALNNLGVLYLRTRRRDDAVAKFEECIRIAPDFDQAYLNLARVYSLENNRAQARSVLLDLLKQHPAHPQAQQALDQLR